MASEPSELGAFAVVKAADLGAETKAYFAQNIHDALALQAELQGSGLGPHIITDVIADDSWYLRLSRWIERKLAE